MPTWTDHIDFGSPSDHQTYRDNQTCGGTQRNQPILEFGLDNQRPRNYRATKGSGKKVGRSNTQNTFSFKKKKNTDLWIRKINTQFNSATYSDMYYSM